MTRPMVRFRGVMVALAIAAGLAGCASQGEMESLNKRIAALEERIDSAMRNSASARIDATTALHVANQK